MEKPILWDTVNTLYHTVMDNMPKAVQERDIASAFVLGSAGTYLVTKGIQWASKNIMDYFIPNFDEKYLPKLEKACILVMAAAPVLYAIIDPSVRDIIMQHPTYASGMAGVYAGGITAAAQNLNKRSKKESLEKKLES